ncbi:MAG: hypothetical protein KAU22_07130 [Desulfuromonadales bacterium]|nr:hypothetical protein [Desulfuromonadales bacterium]
MDSFLKLFFSIVISLTLFACQAEQEKVCAPADLQPVQQNTEPPPTSIDLDISAEHFKKLDDHDQNLLAEPPPEIVNAANQKRKIEISGEVLVDKEKQGLVEKIDGGKVNISIPLK